MPHEETTRQGIVLSARQRVAWLRLIRSDNIGPVTFRELINHFGSAERHSTPCPSFHGGAAPPAARASRHRRKRKARSKSLTNSARVSSASANRITRLPFDIWMAHHR